MSHRVPPIRMRHDRGEAQCDEFILRQWLQVEVQKISQVDDDLSDRRSADDYKNL